MVELNSTVFPFLGPIGSFVNTIKVLIGGVFGIYLIILYLRFREYVVMRRMLTDIRNDIRELARNQGVEMAPIKEKNIKRLRHRIKDWFRKKKEEETGSTEEKKEENAKTKQKKV